MKPAQWAERHARQFEVTVGKLHVVNKANTELESRSYLSIRVLSMPEEIIRPEMAILCSEHSIAINAGVAECGGSSTVNHCPKIRCEIPYMVQGGILQCLVRVRESIQGKV